MKRCYGYVRVSTDRQAESTLGIRGYIAEIIRYAEAYNLDIGHSVPLELPDGKGGTQTIDSRSHIFVDAGVSAYKNALSERPAGRKLCETIRPGDTIVIPRLSRGFRNVRDCLPTVETWESIGVSCIFLDCPVQGGPMIALFAAFAEWESQEKSHRQKQARKAARLAGRPIRHTPYPGFRWVGQGSNRRMVLNPKELAVIDMVWDWHQQGMSRERMELKLSQLRITYTTPRGGEIEYSNKRIEKMIAQKKAFLEIEKATGVPVGQADSEWLQAYFEADAERQAKLEQEKAERAQKAAWKNYRKRMA